MDKKLFIILLIIGSIGFSVAFKLVLDGHYSCGDVIECFIAIVPVFIAAGTALVSGLIFFVSLLGHFLRRLQSSKEAITQENKTNYGTKSFLLIILYIILTFAIFSMNIKSARTPAENYPIKSGTKDEANLKQVRESLDWTENFYTTNDRYPTNKEFKEHFPDFESRRVEYFSRGSLDDPDRNAAQDFSLTYSLSRESKDAVGTPRQGIYGYEGYYSVKPCPRWSILGLKQPENSVYVGISSNFYTGEVYFTPKGQYGMDNTGKTFFTPSGEKISLLKELEKPRLFGSYTPSVTHLTKENKPDYVVVTNGRDVVVYEWDGSELKLKNPKKIGEVPTSCPVF